MWFVVFPVAETATADVTNFLRSADTRLSNLGTTERNRSTTKSVDKLGRVQNINSDILLTKQLSVHCQLTFLKQRMSFFYCVPNADFLQRQRELLSVYQLTHVAN
jgi:hypothetical protein